MTRFGPFWTMLAAVWAFVLLGGAPLPASPALCGAAPGPAHHHDAGCILCCPCAAAGAVQAVAAAGPGLPGPPGGLLAAGPAPRPAGFVRAHAVPVRARGPHGVA